jgi:hypothetical protein
MQAEEVAAYAIEKTLQGKLLIIPGVGIRLSLFAAKLLPQSWLSAITYEIQKKKLQ